MPRDQKSGVQTQILDLTSCNSKNKKNLVTDLKSKSDTPNTTKPYGSTIDQVIKPKHATESRADLNDSKLLQYGTPQDPITVRQLADLIKIYYDDNKEFVGNLFDILDTKLRIFLIIAARLGYPRKNFPKHFQLC